MMRMMLRAGARRLDLRHVRARLHDHVITIRPGRPEDAAEDPMKSLTADRLRELTRTGADVTLKRLRAEIIAIERTFPELALPRRRRAIRRSLENVTTRTRKMSASARKSVSQRMQKYWTERRKAQAKVK